MAGSLGALLGIGGGVFLIPLLNVGLGVPLKTASGISLMTVIATSNAVATNESSRRFINRDWDAPAGRRRCRRPFRCARRPRGLQSGRCTSSSRRVTAVIAGVMLTRLDRRNVILDASARPARSAGAITRRRAGVRSSTASGGCPPRSASSLGGGIISGLLGIGGGILQVPALNAWCGVPMRAAAATTAAHDRRHRPGLGARSTTRAARSSLRSRRRPFSACWPGPGWACGTPRARTPAR